MQFNDLERQYQYLKPAMDAAIAKALSDGRYIMGPQVAELEEKLAAYVGVKHCITCSSGTDALFMALLAKDIGPGDAVFTSAFSFFATAEVIALCGATPVFVDIDARTYNMDAQKLEEAIEQVKQEGKLAPKAVIPVDLFGLCADYEHILPIARKYGLFVLEDAAQSFGATFEGHRAGKFGDVGATSFFPAKPLGCYGDGGALFTDDDAIADRLRSLRVHGKGDSKYDNVRIGLNARLDTIQAAVLLTKLSVFDEEIKKRQEIALVYEKQLMLAIQTPYIPIGYKSVYAQYTVRVEMEKRAGMIERMKSLDVPAMVYYPKPLHLQTAFANLGYKEGDFPHAERAAKTVLALPMYPYMTQEEIMKSCDALKQSLHYTGEVTWA